MKLKVCGMKYDENILEVSRLNPDYLGFIFYSRSKRFADPLNEALLSGLPAGITKVGVFVNSPVEEIDSICKRYGISLVQLHGNETVEEARELKRKGYQVIKVFSVENKIDPDLYKPYQEVADYFLFDTKTEGYGGSGKTFNWDLLSTYDNEVPFFLSGGINPEMAEDLRKIKGLNIHAVDINSCFETLPGLKDADKVKLFKEKLAGL